MSPPAPVLRPGSSRWGYGAVQLTPRPPAAPLPAVARIYARCKRLLHAATTLSHYTAAAVAAAAACTLALSALLAQPSCCLPTRLPLKQSQQTAQSNLAADALPNATARPCHIATGPATGDVGVVAWGAQPQAQAQAAG